MLSIYQDGFLTNQTSMAGLDGLNIDAGYPINVLQDGTGTYSIFTDAKIDELRLWNTTRTTQQIRENMHLTLSCSENGLAAYYQFNETTGDCLDFVGGHHGTLMNSATRITSDIPVAGGVSITKDIQTAQLYSFDDGVTDTHLDIDFSGTLPLGDVVVSNLTGELPHGTAPTGNTLSDSYWVINNYGPNTNGLTANLTFQTLHNWASSYDTSAYEIHKRPSNSVASQSWDAPFNASNADSLNNKVTFSGISSFSQFIISKNFAPTCSDGIQNGIETGMDCGGICPSCEISCAVAVIKNDTLNMGIQVINASNNITSTAQIMGSAMVQYFAGQGILLAPGFNTNIGAEFSAEIQGCSPSCDDGIQNGDEEGVDCGGNNCSECQN